MKALRFILCIITTLIVGLMLGWLTGCSSLPPVNGTYTTDDGDIVTIGTSANGVNITYVEQCQSCEAPIPVTASTSEHPALCEPCTLRSNRSPQLSPIITQFHPVAGVSAGLDYVDPLAYKGWKGTCPGAALDAWMVDCMLTSYDMPNALLINDAATDKNIIVQAKKQLARIKPGGCLWLTVSGHGSRIRDTNGDELDGWDEIICLYNVKLNDDRTWALIDLIRRYRPDIFIFMLSDTCHSGSNYRGGPLSLSKVIDLRVTQNVPNLLHFAGCPDSKYSYGSVQGGVFTTALVDTFDPDITYAEWFERASALMPPNQRPVMEYTGTSFANRKLFDF